jgi:hypothetical protein
MRAIHARVNTDQQTNNGPMTHTCWHARQQRGVWWWSSHKIDTTWHVRQLTRPPQVQAPFWRDRRWWGNRRQTQVWASEILKEICILLIEVLWKYSEPFGISSSLIVRRVLSVCLSILTGFHPQTLKWLSVKKFFFFKPVENTIWTWCITQIHATSR